MQCQRHVASHRTIAECIRSFERDVLTETEHRNKCRRHHGQGHQDPAATELVAKVVGKAAFFRRLPRRTARLCREPEFQRCQANDPMRCNPTICVSILWCRKDGDAVKLCTKVGAI